MLKDIIIINIFYNVSCEEKYIIFIDKKKINK
jgi:hypothetical protein